MPAIAVTGPGPMLDRCAPAGGVFLRTTAEDLETSRADVVVAFSPAGEERERIDRFGRPALLWFEGATGGAPPRREQRVVAASGAVWRHLSLPVADALYLEVGPDRADSVGWLGPDSERRQEYMRWFGHGPAIAGDPSAAVAAINLHDRAEGPSFEHRAVAALAQGRLLVSETLVPARGLEPGWDYLEARDLTDVFHAVVNASRRPAMFRRVRLRGRHKAELFRASAVVSRLARDLALELGT